MLRVLDLFVLNPYYLEEYYIDDSLINGLKKVFKKPCKEYLDGLLLYKIKDLINE